MTLHYEKIKNLATIFQRRFYDSVGRERTFPILLFEMVEYLHYQIQFKKLDEPHFAYTDMVRKCIYLATAISEEENINNRGRLHFTIAHEIAHVVMHEKIYLEMLASCSKDNNWDSLTKLTDNAELEKQADIFASHLLLPRDLLKQEINNHFGNCEFYFSGIQLMPDIALPVLEYLKEKTKASENAIIIAMRDIFVIK
jgi:Zn-dependent peptidase ImmA (M78 family)